MKRGKLRSIASVGALNLFFIALCFVTLIPILYALSVALSAQNTLLSSDFSFIPRALTLDNFRAVFEGEDVLLWFENSMVLARPPWLCRSRRRSRRPTPFRAAAFPAGR